MRKNLTAPMRLLAERGLSLRAVAEEAGLSGRLLSSGATSGSQYISNMFNGQRRLTPLVEEAIRRLVPEPVADEVVRLAAEAYEGRRDG